MDRQLILADARRLAERVLAEDGAVDVTSEAVRAAGLDATGTVTFDSGGIVAGLAYAQAIVERVAAKVSWLASEAEEVAPRATIGRIEGNAAHLLRVERPLLNVLQRACGIATLTRAHVSAAGECALLHTRKTAPGLRLFDALAAWAGGAGVHRLDLSKELLVKDNHWSLFERREDALANTLARARARGIEALWVEVETEEQVREAAQAGATRILVDNQTPATATEWACLARSLRPGIEIEATGGIKLADLPAYAGSGVDYVSIGALTHSPAAADLSLSLRAVRRGDPAVPT